MKRRNADCGKIRRPIKRNKITEGMYGSNTILYMKFLILWAIVITADFMFMFRFEFLWPFWLLLRSVYDSFKYKGLAFSVLFVCIAITSDLVCLFFIPVHWLLFAASTYVWVQYVWHTDKGICLPTIILWMLFVYLEAAIRWKDSRHMPHLDLCRPFAAHCIGYPVVTLGFGFKSYVGYRMRQRKQREVAKENEFYMQLLQQALPQDEPTDEHQMTTSTNNGMIPSASLSVSSSVNLPVAQTVQMNSLTMDHHNHHHHHHHATSSSSSSSSSSNYNSSTNNDEKNHLTFIGQMTTSQTTQTAIQTATSNNHHQNNNLNNSNSSSSSKNAQTNSKLNNLTAATAAVTLTSTSASTVVGSLITATSVSCQSASPTTTSKILSAATTAAFMSAIVGSTSSVVSTTANGHVTNNYSALTTVLSTTPSSNSTHKSHRRSVDKDKSDYIQVVNTCSSSNKSTNTPTSNAWSDVFTNSNNSGNASSKVSSGTYMNHLSNHVQKDATVGKENNSKENNNWDNGALSSSSSSSSSSKISSHSNKDSKNFEMQHTTNGHIVGTNGSSSSTSSNSSHTSTHDNSKKSQPNGNVVQYEIEEIVEPIERVKGRRNRSKKDTAAANSKDNHHNNNNSGSQTSQNQQHLNKDSDSSSISSTSTMASIANVASQIVTKVCETCARLEAEVKKYRTEVSHMKQIENELRQKMEANAAAKSCLLAKQRENDDLEKRLQELNSARQVDLVSLQNYERRLGEERRQRQSLEAQLNNEKKARKLAEEKAARPECSEACKQRKQQIENESKQLRREIKAVEEAKLAAEQQSRKFEQELRMFEAKVRSREAQQGTEALITALTAMQDKNSTLEKNLSAETRVKMDLFSALGEARRQLEIKENKIRSKEDEVLDLKAKIAQLLAVMPSDSLCMPPCSTSGGSMLRMNDTPPLQGPSSPMMGLGTHQQIMAAAAAAHQMNARVNSGVGVGVVVGVGVGVGVTTSNSVTNVQNSVVGASNNSVVSNVSQTSSNLDPNATAYTPKNSSLVGGTEA